MKRRITWGILAVAASTAACGSKSSRTASDESRVLAGEHDYQCPGRRKIAEAIRTTPAAPIGRAQSAKGGTIGSVKPNVSSPALRPIQKSFASVAPATVIVKVKAGFGSGVIVDKSGLVLTNYHVVSEGIQNDFTMKVSVEFGRMTKLGRVVRTEQVYDGVVIKVDPVRDLALVKVIDPPTDLPVVKISHTDPSIGEQVLAVGHAGLGLLWAAHSCNVSQVGDYAVDTSFFTGIDCTIADPHDKSDDAKEHLEECLQVQKRTFAALQNTVQGVTIQTSCNIMPGDSGGPLVNVEGELIGLNQSTRELASFHIHASELRHFLANIDERNTQMLPDLWCEGGTSVDEPTFEDFDQDGIKDTLFLDGGAEYNWRMRRAAERAGAFFLDLDQDNAKHQATDEMPFEAEVALVSGTNGTMVYLDSDNNGHFDLLMVDHANNNVVDAGFRINAAGLWIEDPALAQRPLLDLTLLDRSRISVASGRSIEASAGIFLRMLNREKATTPEVIAASRGLGVPDYLTGGGLDGHAVDLDDDDKPDGISLDSDGRGFLLVPHNPRLQSKDAYATVKALLAERSLRPLLSIITRGGTTWVQYDTNGDQKVDYVLSAPGGSGYYGNDRDAVQSDYAFDAFKIDSAGNRVVAPDLLGRTMIQPSLVADKSAAKYLQRIPMMVRYSMGSDERDSLPDHSYGYGVRGEPTLFAAGGAANVGVMHGTKSNRLYRIDIDGDTQQTLDREVANRKAIVADWTKRNKGKLPEWMREEPQDEQATTQRYISTLNDEVACVVQGTGRWCFYDLDNDDGADLVLFSSHGVGNDGPVDSAYRIDNDTRTVKFAPDEVRGNVLRADVFKDPALATRWQNILAKLPMPANNETEATDAAAPKANQAVPHAP